MSFVCKIDEYSLINYFIVIAVKAEWLGEIDCSIRDKFFNGELNFKFCSNIHAKDFKGKF